MSGVVKPKGKKKEGRGGTSGHYTSGVGGGEVRTWLRVVRENRQELIKLKEKSVADSGRSRRGG